MRQILCVDILLLFSVYPMVIGIFGPKSMLLIGLSLITLGAILVKICSLSLFESPQSPPDTSMNASQLEERLIAEVTVANDSEESLSPKLLYVAFTNPSFHWSNHESITNEDNDLITRFPDQIQSNPLLDECLLALNKYLISNNLVRKGFDFSRLSKMHMITDQDQFMEWYYLIRRLSKFIDQEHQRSLITSLIKALIDPSQRMTTLHYVQTKSNKRCIIMTSVDHRQEKAEFAYLFQEFYL